MNFSKGETICREDLGYPEGALVCDGYDVSGGLLAHPMGGGFQLTIPEREVRRFRVVTDTDKGAALYRRGNFGIVDCDGAFPGWSNGETWNGWEKPRFDRETCEVILKWMERESARYDADRDAFITLNQDGDEETWPGELTTITDGSRIKAYALGAGAWTWEAI